MKYLLCILTQNQIRRICEITELREKASKCFIGRNLTMVISTILDSNEVEIIRMLGSGGFGTVYEASYRNQKVAFKRLHTNTKNKKAAMQSFQAETSPEVLAFEHPNIVKTIAISNAQSLEDEPCFIMEFVSTRNLQHLLEDPEEKIDSNRRIELAIEIDSALLYLHNHQIAHLDLKPVNVLIDQEGVCKLGDFGCCQFLEEKPNTPTRSYLTGTFAYRAPELLKGEKPTNKADIFSFSIVLWQLLTRDIPYKNLNHQVVIFRVVACNLRPTIPSNIEVDNKYKELMTGCWSSNPDDRPSSHETLTTLKEWLRLS